MTDEGITLIDNRVACLPSAVLNPLHCNHTGQLSMIDAAGYLWVPMMRRTIIERAQNCDRCTDYGKNLKVLQGRQHYAELPILHNPNEEVQIDSHRIVGSLCS